jgi:hypothetical protein
MEYDDEAHDYGSKVRSGALVQPGPHSAQPSALQKVQVQHAAVPRTLSKRTLPHILTCDVQHGAWTYEEDELLAQYQARSCPPSSQPRLWQPTSPLLQCA